MGQRQSGSGAERVTRRQAAGENTLRLSGRKQLVPQFVDMLGGDKQLKTEFTGIAGARHHQRRAVEQGHRFGGQELRIERTFEGEVDHLLENLLRIGQDPGENPGRGRSLEIHFADLVRMIVDHRSGLAGLFLPQVRGNRSAHGGIDHDHIVLTGALIDNGVVDHPGLGVEKHPIDAATGNQRPFLGADAPLQVLGKRALQ